MSEDPVSWLVVEKGWPVVDRSGESIGRVDEIVGDTGSDIFSGLKVLTGLVGAPRFVPAERVAEIVDGEVRLDLSKDDVDGLEPYDEPPPSEQFRAD